MKSVHMLWIMIAVWMIGIAIVFACGDDDDDDDDDGGSDECEKLISSVYDQCGFSLESMTAMEAFDMCTDDQGPWDCMFSCASDEDVEDCNDFADCIDFACGVSTNGGGGGGGGGWYDSKNSAYENCIAFFEMYYDCFDIPIDESTIEMACSTYDDWEDLYEGDDCMEDALEDYWACLGELDCEDFSDFTSFGEEVTECATDYAQAMMNC